MPAGLYVLFLGTITLIVLCIAVVVSARHNMYRRVMEHTFRVEKLLDRIAVALEENNKNQNTGNRDADAAPSARQNNPASELAHIHQLTGQ